MPTSSVLRGPGGFAATVLAALTLAPPALANSYVIVDLGYRAFNYAINRDGRVVGETPHRGGAVYRNGHWHSMPGSEGRGYGAAINAHGDVAGTVDGLAAGGLAAVWPRGLGAYRLVAVPDGEPYSAALAIASDGTVAGIDSDSPTFYTYSRCFVTAPDGTTQDLGVRNGDWCVVTGINSAHQISGFSRTHGKTQAFVWQDGVYTNLGWLKGGDYSAAAAINKHGHVVGVSATTSGAQHAFLWTGGKMKDLDALGSYGATSASAISQDGEIVGFAIPPDAMQHAARFEGGQVILLEDEVPDLGTWQLLHADGVNSDGVIIGYGAVGGQPHGFMLVPQ